MMWYNNNVLIAVQLAKKRLLHSTYQLFFASVCMQLAALMLIIIALSCFAADGIEMPGLKMTGKSVDCKRRR